MNRDGRDSAEAHISHYRDELAETGRPASGLIYIFECVGVGSRINAFFPGTLLHPILLNNFSIAVFFSHTYMNRRAPTIINLFISRTIFPGMTFVIRRARSCKSKHLRLVSGKNISTPGIPKPIPMVAWPA